MAEMAKVQEAVKEPNAVVRYYRETVGELRKVVWPTREEAIRLTGIVLLVITVMAAVLGTFDYLFSQLVRLLISL
jgi:preprotein translocase subunit SecE